MLNPPPPAPPPPTPQPHPPPPPRPSTPTPPTPPHPYPPTLQIAHPPLLSRVFPFFDLSGACQASPLTPPKGKRCLTLDPFFFLPMCHTPHYLTHFVTRAIFVSSPKKLLKREIRSERSLLLPFSRCVTPPSSTHVSLAHFSLFLLQKKLLTREIRSERSLLLQSFRVLLRDWDERHPGTLED